jgi:glycosyltransferase involved in cell wall biosynthesis
MRSSDRRAAAGVDAYLTQSSYTAEQIRRFYGREPEIVGVPVDCGRFRPSFRPPEDYWFFCARLVEPYKKASLMLDAFRRMPDEKLIIAGDGPAASELRRNAPANVEFVGHLDDGPLVEALQRCKGVVFPSCDDFGLVPVEAMACGRPVLAYGEGGALQTVQPGLTGEFFREQTPDVVVDAVRGFDPGRFDASLLRAHALYWDSAAFRERLRDSVLRAAGLSRTTSTPIDAATTPIPLPSSTTRTGRFDRGLAAVEDAVEDEQVA